MTKQLSNEELTKLLNSSPQYPTPSRPWGCCSILSAERLHTHGWFKCEWQAKQVAIHLFIDQPVIARHYPRGALRRTRNMS